MATLFEQLKNRKEDFNSLINSIEKAEKKFIADDRFWKPTVDANGTGQAIIRFLPSPDVEEGFILYYNHSFQNPLSGKWFIEKCPTSIGRTDCPVCEANSLLWKSGNEAKKNLASSRKRNQRYVSNIYVISDPKNPETEGKVFLFTYGPRIFQMVKSCLLPEFADQPKFNPFNVWAGANFKMKIKPVKKQRTYDLSSFDQCGPLADDSTLEKILTNVYPLAEFLDPSSYKTYDELKKKFNDVISGVSEKESPPHIEEVPKESVVPTENKYSKFLDQFKDPTENDEDPF